MRSEKGLWKMLAAGMCLLGALGLGSCSLALEEIPKGAEQDRLVGIFVTTEYLPSGELELEVSWTGEVSVKEQERRIYGTINGTHGAYYERQTISFEGVEGWGIYNISLWNEDLWQWEQGMASLGFSCKERKKTTLRCPMAELSQSDMLGQGGFLTNFSFCGMLNNG